MASAKKSFHIRLRNDLKDDLRRVSRLTGTTMTALIEAALRHYLPQINKSYKTRVDQ